MILYGIAGYIIALAPEAISAVVRLYILWQRVGLSILLVDVIGYAAILGVLIYLTKKE